MTDVKLAIQMVGLMQESPCQQLFSSLLIPFAVHILRANCDLVCAGQLFAKLWNAQAAFALPLFAFLSLIHI